MSTTTAAAGGSLPVGTAHAAKPEEKASLTTWIAVVAGMIGAFMAILNIQITNASLLDIEGGIGTGVDNGAWCVDGSLLRFPACASRERLITAATYSVVAVTGSSRSPGTGP